MTTFTGTSGNDRINGTLANDTIYALGGNDVLGGELLNDPDGIRLSDDRIFCGPGTICSCRCRHLFQSDLDQCDGRQRSDMGRHRRRSAVRRRWLLDDAFQGRPRPNFFGGNGNDEIGGDLDALDRSVGGNDLLNGGAGNDLIMGDCVWDMRQSLGGDDTIYGGSGNDTNPA